MSTAYKARIAKGMALLDERAPGWESRINLDKLDLKSCTTCVLGQLFGDYSAGRNLASVSIFDVEEFGFIIFGGSSRQFNNLTTAWRQTIRARLAGAS